MEPWGLVGRGDWSVLGIQRGKSNRSSLRYFTENLDCERSTFQGGLNSEAYLEECGFYVNNSFFWE